MSMISLLVAQLKWPCRGQMLTDACGSRSASPRAVSAGTRVSSDPCQILTGWSTRSRSRSHARSSRPASTAAARPRWAKASPTTRCRTERDLVPAARDAVAVQHHRSPGRADVEVLHPPPIPEAHPALPLLPHTGQPASRVDLSPPGPLDRRVAALGRRRLRLLDGSGARSADGRVVTVACTDAIPTVVGWGLVSIRCGSGRGRRRRRRSRPWRASRSARGRRQTPAGGVMQVP